MIQIRALFVATLIVLPIASLGQNASVLEQGINRDNNYLHSEIDSVNTSNGNLVLHIPLLSYKQRGALPDFELEMGYNNKSWQLATIQATEETIPVCLAQSTGPGPCFYYQWIYSGAGVQIVRSHSLIGGDLTFLDPFDEFSSAPTDFYVLNVADSSGSSSNLYGSPPPALNGLSPIIRTMDGTAISCMVGPNNCIDRRGITHSAEQDTYTDRSYSVGFNDAWSDRFGNTVTPIIGPYGIATEWIDSIGRTIPSPVSTEYPSGCTTYQFPAQNNGTEPYTFCYQSYNIASDFQVQSEAEGIYTLPMLSSVSLPDRTAYQFSYNSWGDLSQISLPSGGIITYEWKTIVGSPLQTCMAACEIQERAIQRRTLSANDGTPPQVWTYALQMGGGTVTDPMMNDTVYVGGAFGQNGTTQEIHYQGPASAGQVLKSVNHCRRFQEGSLTGTGASAIYPFAYPFVLSSTIDCGTMTTLDNGLVATVTQTFDLPSIVGDPIGQQGDGTASLSMGIPLTTTETDYGASMPGPVLRNTTILYQWETNSAYKDANLIDLPASVFITDGNGTQLSQTTYGYDENNGSPQGVFGERTSTSIGGVKTTTVYNGQGMMTDTYDGNSTAGGAGNHINAVYDSTGLFVSSVTQSTTSGIQHVDQYSFDANTGAMTSHTDANHNETLYLYNDSLGRLTEVRSPDNGDVHISYNGDPSPPKVTVTTAMQSTTPSMIVTRLYDGLGRVTQTQLNAPEGTIKFDTSYDALGRVSSVSNPYRSSADPTFGYTSYAYDALSRKALQCQPDNGTAKDVCAPGGSYKQWIYNGNLTTFYDEKRNSWQRTIDSLGRLTGVLEPGGLSTSYVYDALDNLRTVTQQGRTNEIPRSRSFSYDSLSRLLTSSNPETGVVCYGQWSGGAVGAGICQGGYDANGNLKYKTDARGLTTSYSYDGLNRLLAKTSPVDSAGSSFIASCYQYDALAGSASSANQVGHMVAEWTQKGTSCPSVMPSSGLLSAKNILTYDAMGRALLSQQCVLGNCQTKPFTQSQQYDLAGNLISWKDGYLPLAFTQQFDSAGRPTNVTPNITGSGLPSILFSAQSFSPAGQVQNWNVGGYLNFTKIYDTRQRVTSETVTH